jgi:hypothetical protein
MLVSNVSCGFEAQKIARKKWRAAFERFSHFLAGKFMRAVAFLDLATRLRHMFSRPIGLFELAYVSVTRLGLIPLWGNWSQAFSKNH